ncbi:MAG TPA: hypothetical protein G4O04_05000 [Anaerolineae bacterium]|nr:hypothetical protein [Anaerolineae bacterium]HID85586.1 hypothetical protein [Anaerolineales bacterium]HIQ09372.1 hypothetical protein [Anaerolineaceae bacterium]
MAALQTAFRPHIPLHPWLRTLEVAFVPPERPLPLVAEVFRGLETAFRSQGHRVVSPPRAHTPVLFTAAPFGEPVNWRRALMFTARRRFDMQVTPLVWTVVPVTPQRWQEELARLVQALSKPAPQAEDFAYPGLASTAWRTLVEQGRRGGPILALERVVQAQAKSIRVLLVVGEDHPQEAYLFDLVGAHPRIPAEDPNFFYADLVLRIVTAASTREVTDHVVVGDLIAAETWQALEAPRAMRRAAAELGRRDFFTPMVRISDLVAVPAVEASISSQYSEGCFATWEPRLNALIATVTGSARPVAKDAITDDDLAVIVGVRPDGQGALVRHVEGKRNDPPSSEAVELFDMDAPLPRVDWHGATVPVARSKLHGHRGVRAFDPTLVEFVPLDEAYYHLPVSCATDAQARGIKGAFARSQALRNPADPRQIVFTVLPGHGLVMVEKWVPGKAPFQVMWEAMDAGRIVIDSRVSQGPFTYEMNAEGQMALRETN